MAGQRIEVMDIRQIIQFKTQNYSNRKIAKTLGVHRNTVNKYLKELEGHSENIATFLKLSDKELLERFAPINEKQFDRYTHLIKQFPQLRNKLKLVGATLENVWKEYINDTPKGYKYTQFTKHYRNWCKQQKVSLKLEHKAGEQMYVDFTGKKLSIINKETGEVEQLEVFVAILPSSQYTFMTAVRSQKQEDFFEALNQALRFFGGVPKVIVTDNLKAAVKKITKGHTYLTKSMKLFVAHYNCSAYPTRPYSPQDKALVEGAVKLCYQRIFYPLQQQKFFSLSELNKAIRSLVYDYNKIQFSQRPTSRLQEYLDYERNSLAPLPISSFENYEFARAKVQKMGYAYLGATQCYYSVPYRYIGKYVEIQHNNRTVEIYYHKDRIAIHQKSMSVGKYITQSSHLSTGHQKYLAWNDTIFIALAEEIGQNMKQFISTYISNFKYPQLAYKSVNYLLKVFAKQHPKEALENAASICIENNVFRYQFFINMTTKNPCKTSSESAEVQHIPPHKNIRGKQCYN